MSIHTPEPWSVGRGSHSYPLEILAATSTIAQVQHARGNCRDSMAETDANAERIVACVNACAGLNPEAVPKFILLARRVIDAWEVGDREDLRDLARDALASAERIDDE